ncbi:hypothetical protein [Flammeovirga kamogawensis]|uniref:Uncharacterized protein n=1 Tax=Flammeovirga kamogawensis TaxID=373891 RepID=A0ABX8H2L2_9BACT|nr:hypothetical protein [Flammeovirga kamogawensis]MBB6460252.1 hypothetical protein [Flammeovirga kamogawensis]QWG10065.1 hypothetical protein KM029_20495 [Flammeovirga kamogawensis]TRX65572.1 hypothetical protein EO216_23925 [Flammeovirga kamogawensis]
MQSRLSKYSYIFAIALFVFGACGTEMNVPELITPNHSIIKVSQESNENTINIGQHIDFADVSQGISTREWIFPEDSSIVVEGNPLEAQVRGFFNKVGTWDVKLHQEFNGEAYVGTETINRGTNIIDTTITVTVLPSVQITSLMANLLSATGEVGDDIPLSTETPTEIPFGSVLRFKYTAEGGPSVIAGFFDGAQLLEEDVANNTFDMKFVTLDKVYSIAPTFTRPSPFSTDTVLVTQFVKCVRSDEPVTLDAVTNDLDRNTNLVFSRGLDAATLSAEDFVVNITSGGGSTVTTEIESVQLNPNDLSVVIIKLVDDMIYSDDMVTVSYTGTKLATQDAALVSQFTDETLSIKEVNLLAEEDFDYSMENSAVTWVAGRTGWLGGDFTNTLTKSTEKATDGMTSLKISVNPYNGAGPWGNASIIEPTILGEFQKFQYEAEGSNKLQIAFDIFVENNGGVTDPTVPNQFFSNMRMHVMWGAGGAEQAHPIGGTVEGEWRKLTDVVTVDPGNAPFHMGIKVAQTGSENVTIYIDNIVVSRWNPRP